MSEPQKITVYANLMHITVGGIVGYLFRDAETAKEEGGEIRPYGLYKAIAVPVEIELP